MAIEFRKVFMLVCDDHEEEESFVVGHFDSLNEALAAVRFVSSFQTFWIDGVGEVVQSKNGPAIIPT